ncbi:MAG TPA: amidase [Acidimicrobiia bacterium]|nr:amidase [Acidimicrobiia bacterium]
MGFAEYEDYDGLGLADLIRRGEVTAAEVLEAAIERIEARNPQFNAVIWKMYDRARARISRTLPEGPFSGVPFLLKDLGLAYRGAPLTNGSRSLRDYVPNFNGTLADRQEAAGLVILGKTNTPEFGLSPVTEPELHGPTANPWDQRFSCGGSSGGAAAAVAAGMVPLAHASDGGGSIRIPASLTGLFGLKPTRARVPVGPVFGESWFGLSVSHAITRSVRDSAALLDLTHGPEPGDPYAAPSPERPYLEEVSLPPPKLSVALSPEPLLGDESHEVCRAGVHETGRLLESLGHRVAYVEVPIERERLTQAFLTLGAAEAAVLLQQTAELAGKEAPDPADYELATWVLGAAGRKLAAADMAQALIEIRMAGRAMARFHAQFDVLVTSTLGRPAIAHGDLAPTASERLVLETLRRAPLGPALMTVFHRLADRVLAPIPNTPLFNMTGQPAMSVPLHWSEGGLPIGVQFATAFGQEGLLFRLAGQLEEARPWFHRRAPSR